MKKLIVSLAFACFVFSMGLNGQQEHDLLDTKIEMNLSQTNFLSVLQILAYKHKIPVGIELNMTYRQKSFAEMRVENGRITWEDRLEIHAGTLKEILDQLVQQEPEYSWEISDGVVNVYPISNRDPLIKGILELQIKEVTLKNQKIDRPDLLDIISNADKFGELLTHSGVEFRRSDTLNQVFIYENTEIGGFEVKDTNVKTILNKFIRESHQKIWILERGGINNEILSINL